MATRTKEERLDPEVFDLPVEKMRAGYYTDAYFNHARDALLEDGRHPRVVMPASSVPPSGTRGKFSSIKRRENSLTGSELVFETSSLIVSLSSCLPYAQEMRPQG